MPPEASVDLLIDSAIYQALEDVIQGRCTVNEAADVRFHLATPSDELTDALDSLHGEMVELLTDSLPQILNLCLHGTP